MNIIKGYLLLTRPLNSVIAVISIFMGGFVTGTVRPVVNLILAAVSGTLISAGANSVNDVFDLEIDRINKPQRPLPAGMVSPNKAYVFSIILLLTGPVIGFFINVPCFLIASGSSILVYLYSFRLKRTVLWGNLTVALIVGLAFVYGGVAVGRVGRALTVGIIALLFTLGREIIKDVEDMKGDRSQGVVTLPIRYGINAAMIFTTCVLLLLIVVTWIPYIFHIFSDLYFYVVVVGVDFVLIYVVISMWQNHKSRNMKRLSILMKADMFIGLLAVYLGSL